jgi:predicted permease
MKDFRLALRQLARYPSFSAIVIVTLALGLGACTLIFSVVNGVLLTPLPYPEPDRIIRLRQVGETGFIADNISEPNFRDLQEQTRSFSALARYSAGVQPVSGGSEPTRAATADVSAGFFDVVGIEPAVGRAFSRDEHRLGGAPAAIISHAYWQRYFGGDPAFATRTLKIADQTFAIAGVMPPGFDYPEGTEIWIPAELRQRAGSRTAHDWRAVGRLAAGVSREQAQADASAVARRVKSEYGEDTWMSDAAVTPLHDALVSSTRPALLVLLASVTLLFIVATANAANLVLARAIGRDQEFRIRSALGAGRRQLARQFFAETLLLSGVAGVLGIVLSAWGLKAVVLFAADRLPRADLVGIDWTVLGFAVGLSVATATGLSLLAAWRAGGVTLRYNQRTTGGAPRSPLIEGLVVAQVALALLLVVGAALLGRSFVALTSVDPGFRTEGLVFMDVSAPWPDDRTELEPLVPFYDELIERLRALPGVDAVASISIAPGSRGGWDGTAVSQTSPDEIRTFEDLEAVGADPARIARLTEYRLASEDYFAAVGIPLLRGRAFERSDGPNAERVAVVSESLAERLWPGQDPLGKLIQFGGMDGDLRPSTVVGIVADVRGTYGLEQEPRPTFYAPYRQRPWSLTIFQIILRTADAARIVPAARDIVQRMDPEIVPQFSTSEQAYAGQLAPRRLNLVLIGVFGSTALFLALAGTYGSMAFQVARRTHEIGVRMALGARRARVISMVVRRSLFLAGLGVGAGLAMALAASRLASSLLYGIAPHDAISYAAAAAVLLLATFAAGLLPALRAARIDPVTALRSE